MKLIIIVTALAWLLLGSISMRAQKQETPRTIDFTNEGQYFGADWVCSKGLKFYASNFQTIGRCFYPSGFVTLGGSCWTKSDPARTAFDVFRGPVRAFTTSLNPAIPGDKGFEVKCYGTLDVSQAILRPSDLRCVGGRCGVTLKGLR
jgi:hypothetical protein